MGHTSTQAEWGAAWLANQSDFTTRLPPAHHPGEDRDAPEGNIVQAHACQHEQEAVPQHPLIVFVLLLPRMGALWPYTMKLGPILCVGGFPGAAGRQRKGQCEDETLQEIWEWGQAGTGPLYLCVCPADLGWAVVPGDFGGLAERS